MKKNIPLFVIAVVLIVLSPEMGAVVPAPDGGYPGGNTAEGQNAMFSLTAGGFNTAVGYFSLFGDTSGSFNTAVGAGALDLNTASNNTAIGAAALLLNTTGHDNTATGVDALALNDSGVQNTANGALTLFNNTTGSFNTANGFDVLHANTTGSQNTATGNQALEQNTTGHNNTADGHSALFATTTGTNNVAIGSLAGVNQTTGSSNVYIGSSEGGVAGESNACYIASIFGQTSSSGLPVLINTNHKLGTIVSSKRFKEDIKPMDETSEALLALKPVTFHYKKELDPQRISQFGLVAEEVEKVNPDLVVRDKEGKAYSVRYDQVNAMLLNEFLKEHRAFVEEQRTVAQQQEEIDVLKTELKEQRSLIQKVSDRVEMSQPATKVAAHSP